MVRRRRRIAGPGRRQEHAHDRRRSAARPPQHDRGREQERLPSAPRHARRGFQGRVFTICARWPQATRASTCGGPLDAASRPSRSATFSSSATSIRSRWACACSTKRAKKSRPSWACYGIGIERILSAAVELYHDKDGMVLPPAIAPFAVVVTPVNFTDAAQRSRGARDLRKLPQDWIWTRCSTIATSAPA